METSTGLARKADRTNPVKALQTVSAYSSAYDLSLAQKYMDEKSNEIPVTPEMISLLNVKDTIVTWDCPKCVERNRKSGHTGAWKLCCGIKRKPQTTL